MTTSIWGRSGKSLLLAAGLLGAAATCLGQENRQETYDLLTVGPVNYSNVVVQTKTKTDLFFKHAHGFANIKVKDLDKSTRLQLGYLIEDPSTNAPTILAAPEFQIDPRLQELTEQIIWETREALAPVPKKFIYEGLGILFFLYLIFCNCCRLICRKSTYEPKLVGLVWLPLLKQIPLLRAAGMSPWWFLLNFLPPLLPLLFIIWCFRIATARAKGVVVGCLMLLPGVNLFAFLYLALSHGVNEPEDDDRKSRGVIKLYHDKPRSAA